MISGRDTALEAKPKAPRRSGVFNRALGLGAKIAKRRQIVDISRGDPRKQIGILAFAAQRDGNRLGTDIKAGDSLSIYIRKMARISP